MTGTEQFWEEWIKLLKTKSGDTESRLLKEAVVYNEGLEGLVKTADENYATHPLLYLEAMKEYDNNHNYLEMEMIREKAISKISSNLISRSYCKQTGILG